tara:strand:- start:10188 stop:11987 length:1800 start_codon:yes stop_codon:yes gene_type:complete
MAMERVVSYFLTDIEISGDVSDDEKSKYGEFLSDSLHTMDFLQNMMRDRMCYGNAFGSVLVPFRRYLMCPKTGDLYPLHIVYKGTQFDFKWSGEFEFIATCPKTKWRGPWKVVDKPEDEEEHISLKRWSPHEIEILHDPYTDEMSYLWRIPEDYKRLVKQGHLFHLERASEEVLKAIKNDHMFRFNDDAIFHMKEPTLAGIRNRGWGLPRSLVNFRQIYYVQVLRRYNEAIALDYVIPFRLITPAPRGGGNAGGMAAQDPMMFYNSGDFRSQVKGMMNRRRQDPASWQILPFPVNYQMLGGDADQLAPKDLLDQGMETLLNESGTPVELYKGTLSLQAAPVALRLFESTWRNMVQEANTLIQWLLKSISQLMSWEPVEGSLTRVTIADDMNKQMAALQLMMGQQVSGTTGLKAIGYDWDTEQRLLSEEAQKQQELQARTQEEMEQAGFAAEVAKGVNPMAPPPPDGGQAGAMGAPGSMAGAVAAGGPGGGGNPPGPDAQSAMGAGMTPVSAYVETMGPNTPITPNDLQAAAESLAQQLLGLDEGTKDSQLRELKQFNPTLHALVREKMDDIRRQTRMQGGAMLMGQQGMGGGQPGAPPM